MLPAGTKRSKGRELTADAPRRRNMSTYLGFLKFPSLLGCRRKSPLLLALAFIVTVIAGERGAVAQSAESANAGRALVSVGVAASGYTLGYGDRRIIGMAAWIDADTIRRFGFETEMRRLEYHQTANVHAETYLTGVRYHVNLSRTQPYVKVLGGYGHFNFPYNYAKGSYFVIAGGGGVDYRLSHRWTVRADVEYQSWPQFTYGPMNSIGANVGIRCRVF
jgi:hypothetical protein